MRQRGYQWHSSRCKQHLGDPSQQRLLAAGLCSDRQVGRVEPSGGGLVLLPVNLLVLREFMSARPPAGVVARTCASRMLRVCNPSLRGMRHWQLESSSCVPVQFCGPIKLLGHHQGHTLAPALELIVCLMLRVILTCVGWCDGSRIHC